jgi:polyisoprenoid-binding protein YceI
MRIDPNMCRLRIRTRRQGALASLGHDLELATSPLSIDIDESPRAVRARFAADGISVITPVAAADKATIEKNIAELLDSRRHPEIVFQSTRIAARAGGFDIEGELTLHGRTQRIAFSSLTAGDHQTAEITLHQPDWGIRPFSAFLGALKVHPDVTVSVSLPC